MLGADITFRQEAGRPRKTNVRFIIVSREASTLAGLYLCPKKLTWDAGAEKVVRSVFGGIPRIYKLILGLDIDGYAKGVRQQFTTPFQDDERKKLIAEAPEKIIALNDLALLRPDTGWAELPIEHHSVTIAPLVHPVGSESIDVRHPLLAGAFEKSGQLNAVLESDGGLSRIHVVNLEVARRELRRHGGGIIEEGNYVLHPKREQTIVPFKTYHMDMLQEMTREARGVLGRLGAKRLVVETVSGVSFGGSVVSNVPLKSGDLSAEVTSNQQRRLTYEWGSSTYEPESALDDCVWIRDNAGIMTIVDQRRTSNLTSYEEFSQMDTSFRVSLGLMKLFDAKFNWAEKSTYRYAVNFFDRP